MRRKWVALGLALLLSMPAAYASHRLAGLREEVVTGHTILASNVVIVRDRPTDFAAIAGIAYGAVRRNECVVWFNGIVIFDGTLTSTEVSNTAPFANASFNSVNDNTRDPCGKIAVGAQLVAAVEAGDCDPFSLHYAQKIVSAVFVRDLSFLDPNGVTHPVAEIRYECRRNGSPAPNSGSLVQDYAWVTQTHVMTVDPTLDDGVCLTPVPRGSGLPPHPMNFCAYNFSLMVDTCNGPPRPGDNGRRTPRASPTEGTGSGNGGALQGVGIGQGAQITETGQLCTDGGGEEFLLHDSDGDGDPRNDPEDKWAEKRFDGGRRQHDHAREPENHDRIRDGNSNPDTNPCNNPDDHREDKSVEMNDPCDSGGFGETDYDLSEDHLAASVDLYLADVDCLNPVPSKRIVAAEFCRVLLEGALTALTVNHPGCGTDDDADMLTPSPGDPEVDCWDPPLPPDDLGNSRR